MMKKILRANEVATYLGVATSTVWRWSKEGLLPKGIKIGANVTGWNVEDIDDFIDARKNAS